MKTKIILATSLLAIGSINAQTYSEDFSTGAGQFTTLNNTTVNTSADAIEFVSSNNQGGGITLNLDTAGVLGTDFNNADQSIFFQFDTTVPAGTGAQDELAFFFGPSSPGAQTSDITQGGTRNGFTIFFDNNGLFAQDRLSNTPELLLGGLQTGSTATINIEWFLTPDSSGGNNFGLTNQFIVNASGTNTANEAVSVTSDTLNGTNQNLNENLINSFQFTATTTQGLSGSLDNFTVSTQPIPEPSSALLTGLGALALLSRRRRA